MAKTIKNKQVEVAITEVASRLSSSSETLSASDLIWIKWMKSEFEPHKESWDLLAEMSGRHLARADWPQKNGVFFKTVLEWAREQQQFKKHSFNEADFLKETWQSGWKAYGESVKACEWAIERNKDFLTAESKKEAKEIPDFWEGFSSLGVPQAGPEVWDQMAQKSPSLIKTFLKNLMDEKIRKRYNSSINEESLNRLHQCFVIVLKVAPQEVVQERWLKLFDHGSLSDANRVTEAAQEFSQLGCSWLDLVHLKKYGQKLNQKVPVLAMALQAENPEALKVAKENLGEKVFWDHLHQIIEDQYKNTEALWRIRRLAETLMTTLSSFGRIDKRIARNHLKAMSLDTNQRDAINTQADVLTCEKTLRQAFSQMSESAKMHELTAWDFPGFRSIAAYEGWLTNTREVSFQQWSRDHASDLQSISRDRVNILEIIMDEMIKNGVPYPWKDTPEGPYSSDRLASIFERWQLQTVTLEAKPIEPKEKSTVAPIRL